MPAITRARAWLFDVFAHNYAELMRTRRVVERKMHGVSMSDLPYPGSVQGSYNTTPAAPVAPVSPTPATPPAAAPTPAASGKLATVLPWALSALLAVGGAG